MTGYWARPAVLDQISPEFDAVIEASAGTGKTYTLEHLVIDLVLRRGLRLEEILVVTFTEKAAAELAQRLRTAMVKIRTGPWPDDAGWRIDEEAQARLGRALTSFDAASISTIHAFCKRMLAEHAFVNGRLFREELVDGRAAFQETFLDVVRKTLATDPALTPYVTAWLQRDTLDMLTERLYEAHTRGGVIAPPYDEPALISTLKSMSRLELTPTVVKPTLKRAGLRAPTIAACLNRIKVLRAVVEAFHKDQNPAAALAQLEDEDGRRRAEGGLFEYLHKSLAPVVDDIPRLVELHRAFDLLDQARVPLDSAIVQVALPVVQAALANDKRTSGRFDFDDMLRLLDQALEGPARDALLATLRRRFKIALIDEFQDTDRVQWSIFRRVFAESPHHRLVVIGDPKQAIYGFRGADVHTYLDAREHLTGAKTSVVHLTQTYRATPDLAGVLNRLLDQQRPQPFFTGAIRYDHPVFAAGTPPRLTISGQPTSAMHLFAIKPRKDTVAPSVAVRTLNARIAEEIAVLLTNGTLEHEDKRRPVSASDIFILTRTTKEGVAAAEALRRRGLPYAFYKQDGLFQTQEAEDVRTLLAAVAEPHDRGRRLRAWMGPFFAVPVAEAQRCLSLPGSHPLLATLFRFRGLADERKWARLFPQILADTGIIQRELFLADSERELTNYLHIFEILLDEAIRTRATLTDILQTLTGFIGKKRTPEGEDGNVQRLESERAAVQIMTMHKAKGLEAAIVFITGGISRNPGFAHIYHEDGQRRLYLGDQPPPGVIRERDEEDQRLAYVALTRAKTRLYLPYYGGRTQPVLGRTMGTYETIDRALDAMVEDEGVSVEPLLERTFKRTEEAPQPHVDDVGPVDVNLQVPQPPPETAALRSAARGAVITSYSRLKQAQGGYQPVSTTDEPVDTSRMADPETPVDELPGGTASGRFIHEMLELVDLGVVQRQAGWSFWGQRSEVQTLFKRGLRRYDRRPEHLQHSVKMVYDALTLPVHFGDLHLADGIAGADRVIREMEFLYSVPELPTPSNGSYVKGFIDVVLEHDGKVIVLDWKTDLLPDYAPKALTAHVEANYALQADLYSLAVLRLLGIEGPDAYERFGGTAYIFVRGLDADGAGIFYTRPPWSMLSQALDRLRATDLVGGRP